MVVVLLQTTLLKVAVLLGVGAALTITVPDDAVAISPDELAVSKKLQRLPVFPPLVILYTPEAGGSVSLKNIFIYGKPLASVAQTAKFPPLLAAPGIGLLAAIPLTEKFVITGVGIEDTGVLSFLEQE